MIAWFIIGIATLAVFTSLALNATENIATVTELHARTETVRRMEAAVNGLLTAARSPNTTSVAWLPEGRISGTAYILPASFEQYARTPYGQPIVYCPFGGSEAGTNFTISSTNGSSYIVQLAALGGTNYVVGGRPSYATVSTDSNLLGWVMAPRTKMDATPSCNTVVFNSATGKYTARNAIVRPIIRTIGPEESREITTREVVWYVSPTGTGKGLSASDPSALTTALDFWRIRQPYAMRIVFADGNYSLAANYLNVDTFTNQGTNGTLTLQGSGGANVDQTTGAYIQVPGTLDVTGINFDRDSWFVASRGSQVRLTSATAGRVWAINGGSATIQNVTLTTSATDSGPVLAQSGGRVAVLGSLAVYSPIWAIAADAGNIDIQNAALNFTRPTGAATYHAIYVQAGGRLNAQNSSITIGTQYWGGIYNAGYFNASATNLIFNATVNEAISGMAGSTTILNTGSISSVSSNLPNVAFADLGAARIDGSGFAMRASSACWWYGSGTWGTSMNGVLSQSAASATGANTSVMADVSVPALSAATPAGITAYTAALQTNQLRANLRNVNTSNWTCN